MAEKSQKEAEEVNNEAERREITSSVEETHTGFIVRIEGAKDRDFIFELLFHGTHWTVRKMED